MHDAREFAALHHRERVRREYAEAEAERLRAALAAAVWYAKCLEDLRDGLPVAGFHEAKVGYHAVRDALASTQQGGSDA